MFSSYQSIFYALFFHNNSATSELYTLSLHDALPICLLLVVQTNPLADRILIRPVVLRELLIHDCHARRGEIVVFGRSEEHTSELQSQSNIVCRLLLEKKNVIKAAVSRASHIFSTDHRTTVCSRAINPFFMLYFFIIIRLPPNSTLFPYTTLFRSVFSSSFKRIRLPIGS